MKKTLIMIVLFWILFVGNSFSTDEAIINKQKDELKISNFIEEAQKYTKDVFDDVEINTLFSDALKGNFEISSITKSIWNLSQNEIKSTLKTLASILIIIVIHSIFKSVSDNLGNKSVSNITYYIQYILIVTLIMANFTDIISITKIAITNLVNFMNLLTPILITLMITTGSIVSANIVQPIILFSITFIGNIIQNVAIPIILVSTVLAIISQISDKVQIDKLSKFFNSFVIWGIGIVLTIFVGMLSLEGTLGSSIDGLTAKTTKAAVSNFIPIVGKVLGDSIDTVLGCALILKNAIGGIGVVVIIGICIVPIIKLAVLTIMYHLAAALCQPIADEKIIKLMEKMGGTFKLLLGITVAAAVMLLIGVTLVIKISNSSLMYR